MILDGLFYISALVALSYVGFQVWWGRKRRVAIQTTTIFPDIPYLREKGLSTDKKFDGTAVIAGGSLSGFLSAYILSRYYTRILIIDPEYPNISLNPSSRVGQRAQQHAFSSLALIILRELFGGSENFDQRVREAGGIIRTGWTRWTMGKYRFWVSKPEDFPEMLNISRFTFETLIRKLVLEACGSQIEVVRGLVTAFNSNSDGSAIDSVVYRILKDDSTPKSEDAPANPAELACVVSALFVDCTGTTSLGAKLLPNVSLMAGDDHSPDALGARRPWGPFKSHQYDPLVSYRSAIVPLAGPSSSSSASSSSEKTEKGNKVKEALGKSVPRGDMDWGRWDLMTVLDACQPTAETGKEFYAVQRLDGDRILLFHCGWGLSSTQLSTSIDQYIENVHEIHVRAYGPDPDSPTRSKTAWIFNFLDILRRHVENEGIEVEFVPFKMGPCKWIDFQSGPTPNNFVAIGDSRMRLNPPYGQGIKKLLMDITLFNRTLYENFSPQSSSPSEQHNIATSFLARATPHTKNEHDGNRMVDYAFPSTIPQEDEDPEIVGKEWREYWGVVQRLCSTDRRIARWVLWVLMGRAPFVDLFHPYVLVRVWLMKKYGI